MSYQVLARKYRPKSFRELEGQEHVLQALVNALDNDRLHHAYLFTGTRGVGKTTIARILARCLNCETGITSEPCGTCNSCQEISEGRSVDLIEVDAASRTGVDDMRELLDNVQYMPTVSRFKIYLIDEVHMLSKSSFNAMLKTLEEPPEHVKFLFATTDPKKLPITVLSRCLQFNLKNLSPEQVVRYLQQVLGDESIEFDEPALWQLGHAADGSMRDALSLTDQAIAFGDNAVKEDSVKSMLGSIDKNEVYSLLEAILTEDGESLLQTIENLAEFAPDYSALLNDVISVLHRLAVAHAVPQALDNSQGDKARVQQLVQRTSPEQVQLLYQIGLIGQRDLPIAPQPRMGFEMVLLRMLSFSTSDGEAGAAPVTGSGSDHSDKNAAASDAAVTDAGSPPASAMNQLASNPSDISAEPRQSEPASIEPPMADEPPVDESAAKSAQGSSHLSELLSVINSSASAEQSRGAKSNQPGSKDPVPSEAIFEDEESGVQADKTVQANESERELSSQEAYADQSVDETAEDLGPTVDSEPVAPEISQTAVVTTPETSTVTGVVTDEESFGDEVARSEGTPLLSPDNWGQILSIAGLSGVTGTLAANCLLEKFEDRQCVLKLGDHHASLWNASHEKKIGSALTAIYGADISVTIEVGATNTETPAQQMERQREESQAYAVEALENDENVQLLVKSFNGRIDRTSISPVSEIGKSSL